MQQLTRIFVVVVWIGAGMAVVGFVQPWAHIDLREPGMVKQLRDVAPMQDTIGGLMKDLGKITVKIKRGTETITGDLPSLADIPKQVSGLQIPQMANQDNAQVAIALMELFTWERQHLGAKSYAVYLLPGAALLSALLLMWLGGSAIAAFGTAGVCAGVAGFGFYKLLTINTQALFIAITIGRGLWLSLWGYVVMALAATGLGLCVIMAPHRRDSSGSRAAA